MIKSPEIVLWFFSTCAQTFAALVSVFGMFVLYRLQIEEGRIGALRERMMRYHEKNAKLPFDTVVMELWRMGEEHRLRGEMDQHAAIETLLTDYAGATGTRESLSRRARNPILLLVLLTFGSLAGLALYPCYAASPPTGTVLLWLTLAVCSVPLFQIALIIASSIKVD